MSLPTGSGKSLCYAALPLVFDEIRLYSFGEAEHSVVVCVSPLAALMLDQVASFSKRGLLTAHVGKNQTDLQVNNDIEEGKYQLVYMSPESLLLNLTWNQTDLQVNNEGKYQLVYVSPESLLLNLTWREMFRSRVYSDNLAGLIVDEAHLVEK